MLAQSVLDRWGQTRTERSKYQSTLSGCKWAAGAEASPAVTRLSGFSRLILGLSACGISLSAQAEGAPRASLPVPWVQLLGAQRGEACELPDAFSEWTLSALAFCWYSPGRGQRVGRTGLPALSLLPCLSSLRIIDQSLMHSTAWLLEFLILQPARPLLPPKPHKLCFSFVKDVLDGW